MQRIAVLKARNTIICLHCGTAIDLTDAGIWRALAARLGAIFTDIKTVDTDALARILGECTELGVAANQGALDEAAIEAEADAKRLEVHLADIQRLCRRLGLDNQLSTEEALSLVNALLLLRETSVEALSARSPGMRIEGSDVVIAQAHRKAQALRRREAELGERVDLARVRHEHSARDLYRMSDALARRGVLAVLRPEVRRASNSWKRLTTHGGGGGRAAGALALKEVAEHFAEVSAFSSNEQLQSLIGPAFAGHETNFDLIAQASRFLRQTAATMGGTRLSRARQVFSEGEAHGLTALTEQWPQVALEELRDKLLDAQETGSRCSSGSLPRGSVRVGSKRPVQTHGGSAFWTRPRCQPYDSMMAHGRW